jgi:hypothetical protein
MSSQPYSALPPGHAADHSDASVPFAGNDDSEQTQSHGAQDHNAQLLENEEKPSGQGSNYNQSGLSAIHFLKPWWMEIIAGVLVLLSIMAIVLVLALYQNQPLPNWPFGISVNSLVSIFVVILKGGMLLILGEGFQGHHSTC